jgi:hypothetical protein
LTACPAQDTKAKPIDVSTTDYVHFYQQGKVVFKLNSTLGKMPNKDWREQLQTWYLLDGWEGDNVKGNYPIVWSIKGGRVQRINIWK